MKLFALVLGALMSIPQITTLPSTVSYAQLGGDKVDFAPIVDPSTDTPAAVNNAVKLLSAQLSRTSIRARVRFEVVAPDEFTTLSFQSVWGISPEPTYALTNTPNTNSYLVTFPASVTVNGISIPVNLDSAQVSTNKIGYVVSAEKVAPNQFVVQFREAQDNANTFTNAGYFVELWVM